MAREMPQRLLRTCVPKRARFSSSALRKRAILDPTLPELKLDKGGFAKWIGMMDDVDESCMKTIEAFRNHPLIPKNVVISGWVWEVETRRLRAPTRDPERRARTDVTSAQFGVKTKQPPRWS